MKRNGTTIKQATQEWVREFNAIDANIIGRLISIAPEEWQEVTAPAKYDEVEIWDGEHNGERGTIIADNYDGEKDLHEIEFDSNKSDSVILSEDEFEVIRYECLPMWGTMWSFNDGADNYWLEEKDGIRKMSQCGFRIYHHEEYGYFFDINGAGYDFYEAPWIPLYIARGLKWHDIRTEEVK